MRTARWTRRSRIFAGGALLLWVGACSDSTTPSGTTIPSTEVSDIGSAAGDEVDQAVSALTTPTESGVGSPTAPTSCATVDNETDTDGDGAPDAATYTFALPACHFTGFRGGSLDVTGTIGLSDPTPSVADFAYLLTLTDFTFAYTNPTLGRSYTAVRNGTRTLTGNAAGLALSNQITVVRSVPNRADATITHNLLLAFTPAQGSSLALGQPLPDGTFTKSGTFTWARGSTVRTFVVTTVSPLVWDASCTTDRKIASGEVHWTLGDGSYVKVLWTGCGVDPTVSFVAAS
jgi:hypothetical protein